jgi:glycosyltransferase involved in cell wall biosynthesis
MGRSGRTQKPRVLIVFNTVSLYGMERGVIETFALLQPEVESHFLMSYTTKRLKLAVLDEVERNDLDHSFFSDTKGWPRVEFSRSPVQLLKVLLTVIRGNLDVLRASHDKDIIYIAGIQYFYFALLTSLIYKFQRKRVIFHFHDLVSSRSFRLRVASFFVTDFIHNTKKSYEAVLSANPSISNRKNSIIPYPIGKRSGPGDEREVIEAFNGHRNIVFVGQVAKHKGVDLLLEAFRLLSDSQNNTTLHIVGGCNDPIIEQELKAQAANNCSLKYWGYRNDAIALIQRADVYVHPSPPSRFNESFGRGVVEAMSVGVPVVCFRSGALQEIVVHEQTGLVCDEESVEALEANLRRLLSDERLRKHCSEQALNRYQAKYHDSLVKSRWLSLLGVRS